MSKKGEVRISYNYFDGILDLDGVVNEIGQVPFYMVSEPVLSSLRHIFGEYTLTPLSKDIGYYENPKFRADVYVIGDQGTMKYHIVSKNQVVA